MDFRDWLISLGLRPGAIEPGKIHRCPTDGKPSSDNGAFRLSETGRSGWAQDWAVHSDPVQWRAGDDTKPDIDWDELRRRDQAAKARRAASRKRAIESALAYWRRCLPVRGGHPYLDRKGLTLDGCSGIRVDDAGCLVVPAYWHGQIVSLQTISPTGDKRFWPGAPIRGTSHTLTRHSSTVTAVAEGLATGLAVFQSLRHACVIVAWDTGNLARLTALPSGFRVVCADNDYATDGNPGIKAGRAAAAKLNAGIAWPEGIRGTDFADQLVERTEQLMPNSRTAQEARTSASRELESVLMKAALWVGPSVDGCQ